MIKAKRKKQRLTTLTILTLVTVFIWIGFDIFRIFKNSSSLKISSQELKKVYSNFDQKIIDSLKKRKKFNQEELDSAPEMTEFSLENKNQLKGNNASPAALRSASPSAESR